MKPDVVTPSVSLSIPAALQPPVAPRHHHVVRSAHSERVDEYHWLRDDDLKAKRPEVMAYLEAENAYTEAVLAPLQPLQEQLFDEMRARLHDDDSTPPIYDHGAWLWRRYRNGAEYAQLMRRRGGPEAPDDGAPEELLLDEAVLAEGKAYCSVAATAISPDGRWLAWAEDNTGRRIHVLRFKDLATGTILEDRIEGVLPDLAWAADSSTLFYLQQDPVTLQAGAVMRHRLGETVDHEVYREADKTLFTALQPCASREFIVIHVEGFDTTETLAVPADRPEAPVQVVLARRPGVRATLDHLAGRWVICTNEGAPNFRLAESATPEQRESWRELLPARDEVTLERFELLEGGRIALQERVEGQPRVRLLGQDQPVLAADAATSVTLGDHRDPAAAHLRYKVASLVQPDAWFDLHLASGQHLLRKEQPVPGYDKSLYATQRIWATARDGVRIPVTLAWRPDRAQRNGQAPLLQRAYGAYGLSSNVGFNASRVSLLDRGFVFALAHVRGGADLGEAWYEAGRLMHKKNTFNDFVDVSRHLLAEGWAAPGKLFATGGSAGGLLMGVVANEAGPLYRGMLLAVPFVDVITTMLDETIPLTTNEWTQWGDPREKAAHDYMLSYSPYDNLRAQDYPAMLVTTGLWDSQVQYFEPAKYVARLRALKTDRNPLLLHVNMDAGHGGSSGRFKPLREQAREFAFFIGLAAG